jgi:hypothetical protein
LFAHFKTPRGERPTTSNCSRIVRVSSDAREAFKEAKAVAKTDARVLLTDGLPSYGPAAEKEFPNAVHISGIGLQGRVNNNRMERYHSTFKERSKTMRSIKKTDSAFIEGQRIYYDYLRPHIALKGKTPAQAAGIELGLTGNKWEAIIKKARLNQSISNERKTA